MKRSHILMLLGIALTAPAVSHAQLAGSTLVAVSVAEMRDITLGWSAKRYHSSAGGGTKSGGSAGVGWSNAPQRKHV